VRALQCRFDDVGIRLRLFRIVTRGPGVHERVDAGNREERLQLLFLRRARSDRRAAALLDGCHQVLRSIEGLETRQLLALENPGAAFRD